MKLNFYEMLKPILTKDNLIPCKELVLEENDYFYPFFRLKLKICHEIEVYADSEAKNVVDYLRRDKLLWLMSAIAVEEKDQGLKRAPIYGVCFEKALQIATKERFHKAVFSLKYPEKFSANGLIAEICFIVNRTDRENQKIIEFQSWEVIRGVGEIFYVHGEIHASNRCFKHIDGAKIVLSPCQIHEIFYGKSRPKGPKRKLFKIDGNIEYTQAITIIKAFFPIEELSEEVFNIEHVNSGLVGCDVAS